VPAAVAHLIPTGHLAADRELNLAIGLPLRNQEELTNLLQRIYDPASPDYHHYLTTTQFAEMFGPAREDYEAVRAFAVANGLKVTMTHSNRMLLDVAGPVSGIEKTFHVTLRTYQHPREKRMFYAPDIEPSVDLATPILAHQRPGQLRPTASDESEKKATDRFVGSRPCHRFRGLAAVTWATTFAQPTFQGWP